MSSDILVLTKRKGNADNFEQRDAREEQVSLADMHIAPKISNRSCHPRKTLLQRMEEFERFIFRTGTGDRAGD